MYFFYTLSSKEFPTSGIVAESYDSDLEKKMLVSNQYAHVPFKFHI